MTVWFVSRHPGALQWMQQCGPAFDCHVPHLDPADIAHGLGHDQAGASPRRDPLH